MSLPNPASANSAIAVTPATAARFSLGSASDAVRFSILADSAASVELICVVEKDHAPAEHGRLVYVSHKDRWQGSHTSELLMRQARAFLESRGIHGS